MSMQPAVCNSKNCSIHLTGWKKVPNILKYFKVWIFTTKTVEYDVLDCLGHIKPFWNGSRMVSCEGMKTY